jgi:O-acetylhomoserine (thiol)-lyase
MAWCQVHGRPRLGHPQLRPKERGWDGRQAGARFQDALKLVTRLVNIGDAKSPGLPSGLHHPPPARRRMNWKKAGVSEDMVRLSIGIEHIDDILADLDQALAAV